MADAGRESSSTTTLANKRRQRPGRQGKAMRSRRAPSRVSAGTSVTWPAARVANRIVAVTIALVAALLLWRIGDPLGVRPDSWSEAEVIISGWGYAVSGFLAYAGLPQHQIGPPVDPYFLYANYPVLSNVLYGVLHRLGADAHGFYRLPAILASLGAVWLWYRLVTRIVDRATGLAAAVALASSSGFLSYADNIHQQAYPLAPQFGALLCAVIACAPETQRRWRWFAGCAFCLLLVGLITVELHLWLLIAIAGYAVLFGSALPRRWLLLLALPLCLGVGLQWLQSRVGSPVPPEERPGFAQNLYRRSLGFAEAVDTPRDAAGKKISVASYPAFLARRFRRFYLLPIWLVPVLMLFGSAGAGGARWPPIRWPAQVKLLVILLAAALGWMGTMMQQSAVHPATMRQLLPFYTLLVAMVWTQGVRAVSDPGHSIGWRMLVAVVGLATLILHLTATWPDIRIHFDHRYHHPVFREPGWQEQLDFRSLRRLPEGTVILTNHNRVPLIRYWSRRPTYLATNRVVTRSGAPGRNLLELTVNYLRGLYHGQLPPLLYLYRIRGPTLARIRALLVHDPLLRVLATGSFAPLTSVKAQQRALEAFLGDEPAACPVVARGSNWWCFDVTPIIPALQRRFRGYPIPELKDLPPPR